MSDVKDDLDAVRLIVSTLEGFSEEEGTRILRWSTEKLGMQATTLHAQPLQHPSATEKAVVSPVSSGGAKPDLKTFVAEKMPNNDVHFAATVAYFYAFEAAADERRPSIGSEDLQNACRLTARERLQNPGQTLRNASFRGFLDKGDERGQYKLNTVGENLVAVTLPGAPDSSQKKRRVASTKKAKVKTQPKGKSAQKKK